MGLFLCNFSCPCCPTFRLAPSYESTNGFVVVTLSDLQTHFEISVFTLCELAH